MKRIQNWRQPLLFLCSLIFLSSPTHAALISYTDNWIFNDEISWGGSATSRSENFYDSELVSFNLFDASLGVLNSVSYSFSNMSMASFARSYYEDEDWFSETAGELNLNGMRMYTASNPLTGSRAFSISSRRASCSDESATSVSSCTALLNAQSVGMVSTNFTRIDASLLASLTGTGTTSFLMYLGGNLSSRETDGDDGFVGSMLGNLSGGGTFTVTYDYTEHPVNVSEPPTVALLFLGFLGLLVAKRRQVS